MADRSVGTGHRRDLVVVGGGPVGLATALMAARSGLATTVLEPRPGVIDKACGEGLMPGALAALARLGVDPPGVPLLGISYLAGDREARADFRDGPGRGVRRTALHDSLRRAAAAAGVEVLALTATGIDQDDAEVVVRTRGADRRAGPDLAAAHAIAADGLHSRMRRTLGLSATGHGARRHGLRCHYGIRPWSDRVEVHWGVDAEAYVTPVTPDVVGVALLTSRRDGFDAVLRQFGALHERLDGAEAVTAVLGAGPLRQRSTRRVAGRVLLVGDASGYVDALTGEGIALGIAQASAALRAVLAGRPQAYEWGWRRATWRYAALTHALVGATGVGWVRRGLVPAADALPGVFAGAVHELGRVR